MNSKMMCFMSQSRGKIESLKCDGMRQDSAGFIIIILKSFLVIISGAVNLLYFCSIFWEKPGLFHKKQGATGCSVWLACHIVGSLTFHLCTVDNFSVKSFSRKFSWNWFHGKYGIHCFSKNIIQNQFYIFLFHNWLLCWLYSLIMASIL